MSELKRTPHGQIVGQGDYRYKVNAEWGQLDANKYPVENCHDFAIDSQDRIFMVTDNVQNNILVYDQNGKLLDAWGTEFPGIHAIEIVQQDGVEFIYIVDSGWKLNRQWDGVSTEAWDSPYNKVIAQAGTVSKLTMDGLVVFTLGHPQTIGVYQPEMAFNPTDICVADNGDIYITDGYGSDYVLQYNKNGQYIRHWGGHDNSSALHNLQNAHGIAIDNRGAEPQLIISSRAEQCLKVFSMHGEYLSSIDTPGAWIHGPVFMGDHFISAVCWTDINNKNVDDSGFLCIFDKNNKVVSTLGAAPAFYEDNKLQPMSSDWQVFSHVHGVIADKNGDLYVGQWRANNSYPYKLERL
ncbi:6-bladed beta-propeller [Psychrosphaera sp. F3M07]|uniref:6-bladed beta-propeller n=1 Tax=Psychrosphaera sp. F3M07 TaxID=2841560 RepID=UPI001C09FA99|nr:6-bladed beta-propeller [Psychrosphaera sp. F3M07]MBU2918853.1 6-bladed beta-propeller [Psychrosphaera sp. F3M07]